MRLQLPDSVRMALSVPLRNPGRSALTALGLAIGVSAFIAMVSFGRGARGSVVSQFETLGSNLLRIKRQTAANEVEPRPLTYVDVNALSRESTTLSVVVPLVASLQEEVMKKLDEITIEDICKRARATGLDCGSPERPDTADFII